MLFNEKGRVNKDTRLIPSIFLLWGDSVISKIMSNVKLMLGVQDDRYDELIQLYIRKVIPNVLQYCNVKVLSESLESFVEDKVYSILEVHVNSSADGKIKAVTRGDTKIEYNVSSSNKYKNLTSASLTDDDKKSLSEHCVVKLC